MPEPLYSFLQAIADGSRARVARYGCAVLVLVSVLLIFFLPLPKGPFQVTHGPTSALRAARAALLLLMAIAACCGLPLPIALASMFLVLFLDSLLLPGDQSGLIPADDPACIPCELRC